jgi:UDP-glucose 4-epimerase
MKAIVFGGSGFLGSHVADALSAKGYEVLVFDIKPSAYISGGQKMIVGDVLDFKKVSEAVKGCDVVYNFSGIAGIEEAFDNPLEAIRQNVLGNTNILEACRVHKVKRFVFASSIYVYSHLAPFYRSSKQSCELIIEDYAQAYGLAYTILRYGSLYGKRANTSNFIRHIVEQAVHQGKITRIGDGEEVRDYIHVLDAAKSSVDILADEFKNQHVIVTGTQTMKVKELLLMVKEIMDGKCEIEYVKGEMGGHYETTPYSFRPKLAKKLVSHTYHDLGQGILDLIYDAHERSGKAGKELIGAKKR